MQRNIDDIKKKFNHRCYGSVNNSTSPSNVKRENYFYVKFKQIDSLFQKSNKQIHSSLQNKLLKDDSE